MRNNIAGWLFLGQHRNERLLIRNTIDRGGGKKVGEYYGRPAAVLISLLRRNWTLIRHLKLTTLGVTGPYAENVICCRECFEVLDD